MLAAYATTLFRLGCAAGRYHRRFDSRQAPSLDLLRHLFLVSRRPGKIGRHL